MVCNNRDDEDLLIYVFPMICNMVYGSIDPKFENCVTLEGVSCYRLILAILSLTSNRYHLISAVLVFHLGKRFSLERIWKYKPCNSVEGFILLGKIYGEAPHGLVPCATVPYDW
jgi:hypothetical protein